MGRLVLGCCNIHSFVVYILYFKMVWLILTVAGGFREVRQEGSDCGLVSLLTSPSTDIKDNKSP